MLLIGKIVYYHLHSVKVSLLTSNVDSAYLFLDQWNVDLIGRPTSPHCSSVLSGGSTYTLYPYTEPTILSCGVLGTKSPEHWARSHIWPLYVQ